MWSSVPPAGAVILFIGLLLFVGINEGLQIALFSLARLPESEYKDNYKIAHANLVLLTSGDNFARFLTGRQICCCVCMFVAARVVSINTANPQIAAGETSFDTGANFMKFINTGLLGGELYVVLFFSYFWV